MSRATPDVTAVATNSSGIYFQVSTGKGSTPATVKRTRSQRAGKDGYTYLCLTCLTNDACAHSRAASDYFDAHGAAAPTTPVGRDFPTEHHAEIDGREVAA